MDVLVRQAGALSGVLTGSPEDLGGDGITCGMPPVAGKQPLCRLASEPAPVSAQRFEKLRAQHDVSVQASLASPDMDHHALTVNIADLLMRCFGAACPGGIKRHEQDAVEGAFCGLNQTRNLLLAEYLRKVTNLLRIGRLGDAPAALQHVNIEEAQRSQPQDHSVGTELQLGEEHRLILANVLRAKLIGPAAEVPAEVLHPVEVRADGCIGEVAASQLLKHDLT